MKHKGTVYLVGAGPGDAGLLTLRGAELLGRADVVVSDALVNPDLLRLAPAGAEIILRKQGVNDHPVSQEEITALLVAKAREGKTVVRLKGGDPYVFGRGGEEALELAAARVHFEVVPGVSSITAVTNYAGIPLTHRDHCSGFQVLTGHENPEKGGPTVDWARVAQDPGTKVILMGVKQIRVITAQLLANGLAASTPAAMIRHGTTGRQRTLVGTLGTIADLAEAVKFTAPAVTVIGDVVGLRDKLNWFEQRVLFGQRIVVTRTREQASQLASRLTERGAEVLEIPTIKIVQPTQYGPLIEALTGLGEYDWLVFSSPNGVTAFFDYFFKAFDDVRALGMLRIAAVGPATAAKLKELHLRVDAMPEEYVAAKIAKAIAEQETIENLRFLCLRAEVANPDLVAKLEELGGIVDDIACYQTVPETDDVNGAAAKLAESGTDWITFTSASTVENFHARFDLPKLLQQFPTLKTASIGPETSKALAALGLKPTVEAKPHNLDGLVSAIEHAVTKLKQ
jgi:uroporphyrinogen III methyltransferase/synthase